MIDNPDYKNIAFNPTVAYSLGENAAGKPVVIFIITGEDGTEHTHMFPDPNYLRGIKEIYGEAAEDLDAALEHGFDAVAPMVDLGGVQAPDDIRSITDPEEGS